jgi:general secretion pathway protein F
MALYRYRAATSAGELRSGVLDGLSRDDAVGRLRRQGLTPIEAVEVARGGRTATGAKPGARARAAMINAMGELGVLLESGLTLDRALSVCVDNVDNPAVKAAFATLHARMREGAPLSKAVSENPGLFPPMA